MAAKSKVTYVERMAAKVAGRMIIQVRAWSHQGKATTSYWRGFQSGVRLALSTVRECHTTAREVAKWNRLNKRTKAVLDRLNAQKS